MSYHKKQGELSTKAPLLFKEGEKKCGIVSRSTSTSLPFLSLILLDIFSECKTNSI